ncbi:MAG: flagellin [Alphaproteobacteria bacterium]|nr:flagellin [Alphaproteobacteria bacterium]
MVNSINTNIAAFFAQGNIAKASAAASTSVARLSSGNFITRASDDVARLSIGTSFATTVRTLRQALVNASQGVSLLQVADGALGQVTEILQRQKTLAVQASSGNLSNTDRSFLNQEFQALSQQIDFITSTTKFNGVSLIDGSLSTSSRLNDATKQATAAVATIGLSANLVDGDTIEINGLTFTAKTTLSSTASTARQQFLIGATSSDTVANFATKLTALTSDNNATNDITTSTFAQVLGGATYTSSEGGSTLTIAARTGGALSDKFTIDATGVANNKASVGGNYGGATVNLFATNVSAFTSSSTAVVVASSQSATAPFLAGDSLSVTVGTGSEVSLYTLRAGDSLTNIVNGINGNSATTGVTATLIGDSTNGYNIRLNLSNASGNVAINGGDNFYKTSAGVQTTTLSGATSTTRLLSTSLATAIGGVSTDVVGGTATTPFASGSSIFASVAGGAYVDISGALGATDTLTDIATKINASDNAGALGIVAVAENNNITIKYSDPTQAGAISFFTGTGSGGAVVPNTSTIYNTDALGQTQTNGLGGSFVSFNLLSTGVLAPDAVITGAASNGVTPFVNTANGGSSFTISINDSATTTKSFTFDDTDYNGLTLQGLANVINADTTSLTGGAAGTKDYGIHASVVLDSEGKYNLQLSYASSALPLAGTGGTATTSGIRVTYTSASSLATINTTGTLNNDNSNTGYSTVNLFATSPGTGLTTTSVITNATPATATPIDTGGADFVISVNGATITLAAASLTSTLTTQGFIDLINANTSAVAAGVTAELINAGTATSNIQLRIADTAGTGVAATALTTTQATGASLQTSAATTYVDGPTVHTTYRLFTSTFANTLSAGSVVAATPTATTPFNDGSNITVRYSTGTNVNLLAAGAANLLETGDDLAEIVRKINANSSVSGFTAELDGAGTNILLKDITFAAGVNAQVYFYSSEIYNQSSSVTGNGFNNSYSTVNVFAASFLGGVTDNLVNATPSADDPFDDNGTFTLSFDVGGTTFSINQALSATVTVQNLLDTINSDTNAQANGVHAEFLDAGGGRGNVVLYISDSENTAAVITDVLTTTGATTFASSLQTNADTGSYVDANNILSKVNTNAAQVSTTGGVTAQSVFGLAGGLDNGIGYGSTTVTGSVGDALLTSIAQKAAQVSIGFPDTDASALEDAFSGETVSVAGIDFTFVTSKTSANEILIGATLAETIDNAVSSINRYGKEVATGNAAFQLNQIVASRNGTNLVFTGKGISDVTQIDGTAASTIASSVANISGPTNSGVLNTATRHTTGTFGVDVSGISNADFTGKIQGFSAEYVSSNTVNLSVTVGGNTYTATNVNTNPQVGGAGTDSLGNQIVRFYSDTYEDANGKEISGGFFDVQLAVNQGNTVSNSTEAATFGARFNSAFQGLTFNQSRVISSYSGTDSVINASGTTVGSLVGSSVTAQLPTFESNKLTNITVTAPTTGGVDAKISLTIDGIQYSSGAIGSKLGANQSYKLTSATDPNYFVIFTTGDTAIDVSSVENAQALEASLNAAFGTSEGASALSFQIGTSSADALGVSIGAATTDSLFEGKTLSITSIENATEASDTIDAALQTVTSIRASVGALQSRFNFASANIQISVQNQDASRSELLDTDIAAESTSYATAQVQLQAGISVLAQANQQLQNLLKLLG